MGYTQVQVTSPEASILKSGQEIIIDNTQGYDGHHRITKIDDTTFEIDFPWSGDESSNDQLGRWQVVPPEEQALVFDGVITGYEMTIEGKLRVTVENHGLENGDEVQIFDTTSYNGVYPITKVDGQNFIINDLRWQTGEAVNLKMQSQKRRGIVFDGQGDYISLPDNPDLHIESYTVEVWIKPEQGRVVYQGIIGKPGRNFNIWLSPNGFIHHCFHTTKSWNAGAPNTPNGSIQWNHVAITNDGTTAKTYINGALKAEGPTDGSLIADKAPLYIARHIDGKNPNFFKGQIADARIWKIARTAEEIKNSMYLRLSGRELNLVGYWRLGGIAVDEDNQRKVIDFSVNQNDADVYEDCYVSAATLKRQLESRAMTEVASGIVFDGKKDIIQVSSYNGIMGANARTVEAWIKTTKANATIVSWGRNYSARKWVFCVQNYSGKPGALRAEVNGGYIVGNTAVNDGNWHHVACTFENDGSANITDAKLYVDGRLESISKQDSGKLNTTKDQPLRVGQDPWNRNRDFKGEILEVRVWNVARTADEIKSNMYFRLNGKETGLVGYWQLGYIAADKKVKDFSVNQNDGTVSGDCHVKVTTLNLQSRDNTTTTDVVQYSNKQLFAVTQQATYEESFEFTVTAGSGDNVNRIVFDGVNDHIKLSMDEPETEITHELWFKTSTSDTGLLVVSSTKGGYDRDLYLQKGNLNTRVWNNEVINTSGLDLADGKWHHIAHVIGSSIGGQKIYIDGKLEASGKKAKSDLAWIRQR